VGVSLRVEPADGLSARVDPDRVRQAVDDLLDNAFRHGGREVVLAAAANGEGLLVSVEDDGPGFPAEILSGNGADASNASGLGLTVVRAIAAGHGGTLALENPGRGARAVLSLPN